MLITKWSAHSRLDFGSSPVLGCPLWVCCAPGAALGAQPAPVAVPWALLPALKAAPGFHWCDTDQQCCHSLSAEPFPRCQSSFRGVNTPPPVCGVEVMVVLDLTAACIADCVLGCISQTIMLYYLMVFSLLSFCCRRFRCCLWASLWEEFWQKGGWPGRARRAAKERSSSWDLHKDLKQCEGCWK